MQISYKSSSLSQFGLLITHLLFFPAPLSSPSLFEPHQVPPCLWGSYPRSVLRSGELGLSAGLLKASSGRWRRRDGG